MGSTIKGNAYDILNAKPPFLYERLAGFRSVGLDVSSAPKAHSTDNHTWFNANTGRWTMPAGTILSKITASGLYAPMKAGVSNGLVGGADIAVTLFDFAAHFAVGDIIGNGTDEGAIASITYATGVMVIAAPGGGGWADKAHIFDDTTIPGLEGSANNIAILLEDVDYTNTNDQDVSVIEWAKINESALAATSAISATMKGYLPHVQWV